MPNGNSQHNAFNLRGSLKEIEHPIPCSHKVLATKLDHIGLLQLLPNLPGILIEEKDMLHLLLLMAEDAHVLAFNMTVSKLLRSRKTVMANRHRTIFIFPGALILHRVFHPLATSARSERFPAPVVL
jgi:hypothetical protein